MSRSKSVRFEVVEYKKNGEPQMYIDDDDFGYDACIKVSGDWDYPQKLAYAQAVADALNAAGDKIPVAQPDADGEKP